MRFLFAPLFLVACGPPSQDSATPLAGTAGGVPTAGPTLRIATWNVEGVGAQGSDEYEAMVAILDRIDADIVGLNEVDNGEADEVQAIADLLGYDTVIVPSYNPFGDLRNAMLSRVPLSGNGIHSSDELSGDPSANDVTREPVSVTTADGLQVAVMHCKSGFDDSDEFRRTIDGIRLGQVAANPAMSIIMGDINQEVDEPQDSPPTFTSIPSGMPSSYFVGEDLYAQVTGGGLSNGPHPHFQAAGYTIVEATQMDGSYATRNVSGRRIDYVMIGSGLAGKVVGAEIYDARDDGPNAGLPKAGEPPLRSASETAADHLPVFVDLSL